MMTRSRTCTSAITGSPPSTSGSPADNVSELLPMSSHMCYPCPRSIQGG
jgi:hypothetical protein